MKKQVKYWLLAALAAGGCARSTGDTVHSTLAQVSEEAAGANCAQGGVAIAYGTDANGDGVLDASEIATTHFVCNGSAGVAGQAGQVGQPGEIGAPGASGTPGASSEQTTITTTVLEVGDRECPAGGVRIDILVGDIASAPQYVCNGVSSENPNGSQPPGPTGTAVIDASGSDTTNGNNGGSGGRVEIRIENGSGKGNVKLFQTGSAQATIPTPSTVFNEGQEPLVVAGTGTTIGLINSATDFATLPTGLYMWDHDDTDLGTATGLPLPFDNVGSATNDTSLLKWTYGGDGFGFVTSIDIEEGGVLTLPRSNSGSFGSTLSLQNDLRNAGTINIDKTGLDSGPITLNVARYIGQTGSLISTRGSAGASGATGGNGGALALYTRLTSQNAGTISANGGAGAVGGAAGPVEIGASQTFFNGGTISAKGGDSNLGAAGGNGGGVAAQTADGHFYNSGTINTNGGAGAVPGGGGSQSLGTNDYGDTINTGTLTARAGAVTGCTANCNGNNGGSITLWATGGKVTSNQPIDVRGSDSVGEGTGGNGGSIDIYTYQDDSGEFINPAGSIYLSGSLLANAGAGGDGGGGYIHIHLDPRSHHKGQEIVLLGYASLNIKGGTGGDEGGDGGDLRISNEFARNWLTGPPTWSPAGGIVNHVPLHLEGGNAGIGGGGGVIYMIVNQKQRSIINYDLDSGVIINHAYVGVNGATGTNGEGDGGNFTALAIDGIEHSGDINASGYHGGRAKLWSYRGTMTCTEGSINAQGTSSNGGEFIIGDHSQYMDEWANGSVVNHCDANVSGTGGNGGLINFYSDDNSTVNTSDVLTTTVGGSVMIQGENVTLDYNTFPPIP